MASLSPRLQTVAADLNRGTLTLTFDRDIQTLDRNAVFYPDQHREILDAASLIAPTLQQILSGLLEEGKVLWAAFTTEQRHIVQIAVMAPDGRNVFGLIERLTPIINGMNLRTDNEEIGSVDALKAILTRTQELTTWNGAVGEMVLFLDIHFSIALKTLMEVLESR